MTEQRITIVSADGHVGGPVELYRPYMDPAYRHRIDDLIEEEEIMLGMARRAYVVPPEAQEFVEYELENVLSLCSNMDKRLKEMDSQGIAADFVILACSHGHPFFTPFNREFPADVRAAGVRGFHRWVVDLTANTDGRLLLNGEAASSMDLGMDESLTQLKWMAERGFVSVTAPGARFDDNAPPLSDPYYEPFWAACEDYGIALNMHSGWGVAQGPLIEVFNEFSQGKIDPEKFFTGDFGGLNDRMAAISAATGASRGLDFSIDFEPRNAMWQMMMGGVFDRHPKLKLVLTEIRADWVPATLAHLDRRFKDAPVKSKLKPSEYWGRNIFVTPSSPRRHEIERRHDIGVDTFMFGADFPHPESTWPNTMAWLRSTFYDVPEDEARAILGGNAIRIYGFDKAKCDAIAAKIGPKPSELFDKLELDKGLASHFDQRSGYLKPAEQVDGDAIDTRLAADFARA